MKIDSAGPARAAAPARRGERGGGTRAGDFARHLDTSSSATGVTASQPMGALDAILALQQVEDDGKGRPRAAQHGNDILDRLEELRLGLLTGSLTPAALEALAGTIRRQRPATDDPRLRELLDEIELRAEVELAKLSRDG